MVVSFVVFSLSSTFQEPRIVGSFDWVDPCSLLEQEIAKRHTSKNPTGLFIDEEVKRFW